MKNIEIEKKIEGLEAVAKKRLPVNAAYIISKNLKRLYEEFANLRQQRSQIMEQHCSLDEEGNPIVDDKMVYVFENAEARKIAIEEYLELLEAEADLDVRKVPLAEITRCDEAERYDSLTAEDLLSLDFMLE